MVRGREIPGHRIFESMIPESMTRTSMAGESQSGGCPVFRAR